ncbi:TonB-dependent receptor plug domain-containing protein [Necropsobacter massiliensis]|uniref:TonB-dependent receptor plug domain-containing protein n=1 Tax=Necropsobacter massiliensis TaxID=1400001 RepID=UPI0005963360|nr:TonB-dependent receptor [Necropsobacter massiliensis]
MKRTLLCVAISAVCVGTSASEVFELGQIEVVSNAGTDADTAVIEQSQMQQNQLTNVAQVAKITPGVFFERKGGRGEQNIRVRGFDSRRVPVFIDGIPVYVPYDGTMDLGRFMTFDLAQVDISKGASSVLYGANTLGGAVNLVSYKPTRALEGAVGYGFQRGRSSDTAVNQGYFNLGSKQQYFYAQVSGSLADRQGLQLSNAFNPTKEENGGRAENSKARDQKLSLKLAYTPNSTDEYALSYSNQRGDKQQPLYTGESKAKSVYKYWRWPAWDKESLYFLSHTTLHNGAMYIKTKAFYDRFENDLSAYDDATFSSQKKGSSFNSHYRDYSYGAGLEFGYQTNEKNALKLSALYKFDVHREHNDDEPVARSEDRNYSVALEDTYRFTPQTNLVAGISVDRREAVKAQNYQQLSSSSKQKGIYEFNVDNRNAFNYQFKLNHSFDSNDELSLSYAHKTRFPTMKDRYSRSIGKNKIPNPFLKPEKADHYEIGYFRTFGDWLKVEGALFYSQIKDAIDEIALDNGFWMNTNFAKETFKGAELGVTAFVGETLTLGANYTYIRVKLHDSDTMATDVPKHKFFAYADWKLLPQLSFYISQSAETGRYSGDGRLPGFGITDVKLTYDVNAQLKFDIGVGNVFDKNYYYADGFAEEGRVYFTNLKYSF